MSVQLSDDQRKAVDGIHKLFNDTGPDKHAIAVLTGSAGTGKTTTTIELIRLLQFDSPVTLCATTNRAAVVLAHVTAQEVITAHNAFKLKPSISKYGKEKLIPTGICTLTQGATVIIDETSMLGNTFLMAIVDIVKSKNLKIIFVGDPYQLPPPKDKCSIFDGSLPTFTLTQVHRQKEGNPILDKAIEYRDYIAGKTSIEPVLETSMNGFFEGIQVLPHNEFVSQFVQRYMYYNTGDNVDSPLCTYTNDSAIAYNNMIRKAAYFLEDTVAPFYKGEQLISNAIVEYKNKIILANNEVVTVQNYTPTVFETIRGYDVGLVGDYDRRTKSEYKEVFVPINKAVANVALEELKKEAILHKAWGRFYKVKNGLADLRPPFAGTTHKSQGGTYTSVFIDQVNIKKCKNPVTRARLMYVALTRATKNVFINS